MPPDDQDLPSATPPPEVRVRPEDVAATFCATLVDEWARAGTTDAVVCPGSRSTPIALALWDDGRIRIHVHHDERAAAFIALGLGLASGRPALVVTTSGTAAAELHPAIVEAHQAGVPVIAVTADRPAELHDVGAAQTIDQTHLFGRAVRWFHTPGVPDATAARTWRSLAARAVAEAAGASGRPPGPVHLDLAFREPLVGRSQPLPDGRPDGAPWSTTAPSSPAPEVDDLVAVVEGDRRVLVVAGREPGRDPADTASAAVALAGLVGAPLLVDARLRGDVATEGSVPVVGAADVLLRDAEVAAALRPEVVVHVGEPPASRVVTEWIGASGAVEVRVGASTWTDPTLTAALRVRAGAAGVVAALEGALVLDPPSEAAVRWCGRWAAAETAAQDAVDGLLGEHEGVSEPGVARSLLAALDGAESLVVASSMPIRDVEWFARPRRGVAVHANRGANGIDGVVSTAVGVALATGRPTACLVGDVALLHDGNALLGLSDRAVDLTVVVVDNDGGGIFSFLPQATSPGGPAFEALFGTPHGVDLRVLAAAHGLVTIEPAAAAEVGPAVRASLDAGGARLVRVATDRAANVALHRELAAAVAAASRPALGL